MANIISKYSQLLQKVDVKLPLSIVGTRVAWTIRRRAVRWYFQESLPESISSSQTNIRIEAIAPSWFVTFGSWNSFRR